VGAVHQLTKVAASGEPAPGGGFYTSFGAPVVNSSGAIAFPAVSSWARRSARSLSRRPGRPPHLFLGTGDPAPTDGIFARFSPRGSASTTPVASPSAPSSTGAGRISASSLPTAPTDGRIAARGQAAPGGGVYTSFGAWPP